MDNGVPYYPVDNLRWWMCCMQIVEFDGPTSDMENDPSIKW